MEAHYTYGTKEFQSRSDLFDFLFTHKKQLTAQKRAVLKKADCVSVQPMIVWDKDSSVAKDAIAAVDPNLPETLKVVVIINTTNFLDGHGDVHIPGLWTKSLSENKMIMHLQEHEMEFENIISDGANLKAYTRSYTWKELGFPYDGITEGLTFESTIEKKRNEFMLNQYKNGWVRNHSVGMYYVKVDMAINDEKYPNEYAAWQKYYPMIANSETADQQGYFWYVLEAKCVEGSAVPIGSNQATPTLTVEGAEACTVKCDNCGADVNIPAGETSAFCTKCGTQTSKEPPIGVKKSGILGEVDFNGLITLIKSERN